jgi:hypothetical protein
MFPWQKPDRGLWPGLGVAAVALAVYIATLAPHLTFAHFGSDGGDLITAAWTLGVPHPPGYPAYTLLAWLFTRLPVGSVAYRVNLLSAVCAAAAVGLHCYSVRLLLPPDERPLLLQITAALLLAFSPLLWSQAVIAEVYALLTFFAALLIWLLARWRNGAGDGALWSAAFVLGLGLGNHLTLVFAAPAVLILLWPQRRRWLRARVLLPAVGLFVAGLSIYAYLPLAAAHDPPVNWGDPRTWERFLWMVTAKQYQRFVFGLPAEEISGRISRWNEWIGDQLGWWGLPVVLVGAWSWWRRDRRFVLFALTWIAPLALYSFFYRTDDSCVYLLPALLFLTLWWGEGARRLLYLARRTDERLRRNGETKSQGKAWQWAIWLIVVLTPLASLALHWREVDLSDDWSIHTYVSHSLQSIAPRGLVVVRRDKATFILWYAAYVEGQRPDAAVVNGRMLAYPWYREQVRRFFPHVILSEPSAGVTTDDIVHDLILDNLTSLPIYAADPADEWKEWFDFVPEENTLLYRVHLKTE